MVLTGKRARPRRDVGAVACLLALAAALWLVPAGGAASSQAASKPAPTTTDTSAATNDFKGWIPLAIGGAFVVAVGVYRRVRRPK